MHEFEKEVRDFVRDQHYTPDEVLHILSDLKDLDWAYKTLNAQEVLAQKHSIGREVEKYRKARKAVAQWMGVTT